MDNDQEPRCSYCMVIKIHNFKILPFLLKWLSHPTTSKYCYPCCLSHPTVSKFYQPSFLEIGRNYKSNIIVIVNNITVLMSHNVIFHGSFMPMSHGVNKKTCPSTSSHISSPYQVFIRFVCSFTRNTLSTFAAWL